MDKKKFVKDVWGELPPDKEKLYIKNVDNVLATLQYDHQVIIRLKYSKVPFTKISRIIKSNYYGSSRPANSKEISRIFHGTLQYIGISKIHKRIFEGEVFGDISHMKKNQEER